MAPPTSLIIPESALSGKLRFKLRATTNCLFGIGIMIVVALLCGLSPYGSIATFVAIPIVYYLVFFVMNDRAIKIWCPGCGKAIRTNTPWICGFCQRKNERVDEYPFVHKCQHCGAEPKAYQCHHTGCEKLIFLTEDSLERNYARCADAPVPDEAPKELTERQRKKDVLIHKIEMAELKSKLNTSKGRLEMGKKKTPREAIEEDFDRYFASRMGAEEYAREKKTTNAELYKNDLEMLEKANASVDDWLRGRL